MRHALPLALLLLFAGRSFGQSGSGEPPRDSLVVCFTIAEAMLINDSLWTGVDRRRAHAILAAMYSRAEQAGKGAERDLGLCRDALKACRLSEEVERRGREEAEAEVVKERKRGKAKWWTGAVVGGLAGGGLVYGLARALR